MTPQAKQRLFIVAALVLGVGAGVGLTLAALSQQVSFYYSPTTLVESPPPASRAVRLGGLVAEKSIERQGTRVIFRATDTQHTLTVEYEGITPDLFREGQGVVAEGYLREDGVFIAQSLLARHDENYMPPEVAKALKDAGAMPHEPKTATTP